jgi:hypothetical protein
MLVNHGSTDAPTVDVVETSAPAGTIVDNISYPNFIPNYLSLILGDYIVDVRDETGTTTVASYLAPLAFLDLEGSAITVIASGFLNPANNSDGPSFGLWVATAAGGPLLPLPLADQTARVQVIHNSPDLAAAEVDVYLNDVLLLDDFAFRTATPFVRAFAFKNLDKPIKTVIFVGQMVGGLPLKKNDHSGPGNRKITFQRMLYYFERPKKNK